MSGVRQRLPDYDKGKEEYKKKKAPTKGQKRSGEINHFSLAIFVCSFLLIACLITLFLRYPSKNYPVVYDMPSPPKLEGVLAPNDILTKATRYLEGKVEGPEHLVFRNGFLYTGTSNGKIIEISKDGKIRDVARIGKEPCNGYDDELTCGRPLGLKFDTDGYLVVCDSYLGLFKVDVTTGDVQELLSSSTEVDGHKLKVLNGLEITDDGDIYFTDSTVLYTRRDFIYDMLQAIPSGRLLKFDPVSGKVKVLLDNLNFPNGLLLSQFQDYILVSETVRSRIIKYNIKGINAGQTEIFVNNLPCFPDNLQADRHSHSIWVACGAIRHADASFNIIDFMQKRTWLRRFFMELPLPKFVGMVEWGSMLLEITESGQIKRAFMDLEGKVISHPSHVTQDENGKFVIGSYVENYIGVLDPKDIPAEYN